MGATPDQLEREIVEVREDLARTITAIEERVNPKRVVKDNLQVVIGVGLLVSALIAFKVVRKHTGS
ncbi:MAG: hypothetical protein QOJ92_109 [Frankiales bacterium]|nr:hypothetical protein [Frankiales bacterium]MDX6272899.1 hypothetical protein [Frankiales bacterium]